MDMPLIKEVALFIAGVFVAAVGYIVKRRIERRAAHEDLDIKEKLLKINRELVDQRLNPDELRRLETTLKRTHHGAEAPSPTVELVEAKKSAGSERIVTQYELNQSAGEEYETAELALQQADRRLRSILEGESLAELEGSQAAWREYRDRQVAFAGGFYRGGSIAPFIRASEAAALTNARARDLRALYEELQSR